MLSVGSGPRVSQQIVQGVEEAGRSGVLERGITLVQRKDAWEGWWGHGLWMDGWMDGEGVVRSW